MKIFLLKYWDRAPSSFWFVPAIMACLSVALASVTQRLAGAWMQSMSLIYTGRVERRVGAKLFKPIDHIVTDTPQTEKLPSVDFLDMFSVESPPVPATGDDYLRFIDKDDLMEWAEKEDTVIRLQHQPEQFVVATRPRFP